MSNEQQNSDPLPYTQVDRAVKPKATLLAAMMKSSTQHALGSLVEFWDLNGDPRELERLLLAGKREVVLKRDEVQRRFRLASGHEVDADDMGSLGLLERIGDEYRVRGMSRYFEPVERRLQARAAASAGGKASAAVRKEKTGTAQPRSAAGSEPVREPLKRTSKRSRSDSRSDAEANAEANAEAAPNTAVSGQRSAAADSKELLPPRERDGEESDPRHVPLRDKLFEAFRRKRGTDMPWSGRQGKTLKRLLDQRAREDMLWPVTLLAAFERALLATHPDLKSLEDFERDLVRYVGKGSPSPAAKGASWTQDNPDTGKSFLEGLES